MNAPCRLGRPSSTSTATTSDPAAAGRRSPPWSACSPRSASPRRPSAPPISRMVRQGWLLPGPAGRRTRLPAHRPRPCTGSTRRRPGSTAPTGPPGTAGSTWSCSTPPERRADRARLTATLAYLGLRPARPGDLGAPRARPPRSTTLLKEAGVALRTLHRHPRRRHGRRRRPGAARLGSRRARRRVRSVRGRPAAALVDAVTATQRRRGGVRRPVPAGPRLADVPVPRPAAAPALLPDRLGRAPTRGRVLRPARRPGCARPPTDSSTACLVPPDRDLAERDAA